MYNRLYTTSTYLYTLFLKNTFLDSLISEKEENDDEFVYPEVGDVLFIKAPIGNYQCGDFFFAHSQDEGSVSDCSLKGVTASKSFYPTIVLDDDIYDKKAVVISNEYVSTLLWELHLKHLSSSA